MLDPGNKTSLLLVPWLYAVVVTMDDFQQLNPGMSQFGRPVVFVLWHNEHLHRVMCILYERSTVVAASQHHCITASQHHRGVWAPNHEFSALHHHTITAKIENDKELHLRILRDYTIRLCLYTVD